MERLNWWQMLSLGIVLAPFNWGLSLQFLPRYGSAYVAVGPLSLVLEWPTAEAFEPPFDEEN